MRKGRCLKWSKGRTRCMRRAKGLSGLGRARRRKGGKKACMSARGKVKKGWRLGKGGRCIKAKRR